MRLIAEIWYIISGQQMSYTQLLWMRGLEKRAAYPPEKSNLNRRMQAGGEYA
jgi:hypothetical protein